MSKVKKKIANNRLKKQNAEQMETFKKLKYKMQKLMEAEDYVTAMDVMAEMAANKKIDGEVMYWGAMCYFHTGDYGRAAIWINNALSCAGAGNREMVLLSAICIADERYEDGLKVMEAVLSGNNENMSKTDRMFMLDVLEPVKHGYDGLLSKYPRVKELLFDGTEKKSEQQPEVSALAKLRAMLDRTKGSNKAGVQAEPAAQKDAGKVESVPLVQECTLSGQAEKTVADEFDTDDTVQQIMAKEISVQEKVNLLNNFAAGCYQSGDYRSASELLSKALQLDAYAPEILKNMAYVCLAVGEKEQALKYAAKLPMADFGLLYALKNF